jgi:alpha-glucuronidase
MKTFLLFICAISFYITLKAEDGYRLWLRYDKIKDAKQLTEYQKNIKAFKVHGTSATLLAAKNELQNGLAGMIGLSSNAAATSNIVNVISLASGTSVDGVDLKEKLKNVKPEGFVIFTSSKSRSIIIASATDIGALYGTFHFLRLIQTNQSISNLSIESSPKVDVRILNHWDNLDRTVERGYAGFSLWDWQKLPEYIDPRYIDYARANASIGINGAVLTNVNANALILREDYLKKVAAIANTFRPYGIRVYLTARFSAPIELGGLKTADPLDPQVQQWWKTKVAEIYKYIPDFGGFTVKANSEGQPGPQNYKRSHADGANMIADAVDPFKGIVMWRAFVYDNNVPDDRAKQAYSEFKPLDGSFRKNVLVQVKNGPIDFQPREPFHPLFGAMPKTPLMMEFQITQEYLGFATHLVYLPTLFKECLDSDTYSKGEGSTVARVVDGSVDQHTLSGMAGVANIGNDRNWTGHPFAQSNWYGFGRLAWDHTLSAETIANEWIRMTFTNHPEAVNTIRSIMMPSREILVNYMTPLGLHHIMGWSHHYGPGPWIKDKPRADWTSVYYHQADTLSVGFDRTSRGSKALSQYAAPVQEKYESLQNCPEEYLLWFHHVRWDYKMKSGKTLWQELCYKYSQGVDSVRWMQRTWAAMENKVDADRFSHVKALLAIQEKEAVLWRNACLTYFQTFSRQPIPAELEKPDHTLEYYQNLSFPYAPGIRPGW